MQKNTCDLYKFTKCCFWGIFLLLYVSCHNRTIIHMMKFVTLCFLIIYFFKFSNETVYIDKYNFFLTICYRSKCHFVKKNAKASCQERGQNK